MGLGVMKYQSLFTSRYQGKQRGKNNKWFRMLCPFHKDKHPSLDADLTKSGFKCWSCGMTGNHIDLIRAVEKVSDSTAWNILSKYAGGASSSVKLGIGVMENEKVEYLDRTQTLDLFMPIQDSKYKEYLKKRKIKPELWNRYDLRQGSEIERGWGGRIVYGIYDLYGNLCSVEGRVVDGQSSMLDMRYRKWTGSSSGSGLYGIRQFDKKVSMLFIVEGVFDCLSIIGCGFNAVAMACSELTDIQINQIRRITSYPVVILDGVKTGTENDRERVWSRINKKLSQKFIKYKVHTIQDEDTDCNDLHIQGKLRKILRSF
jgi:DNA primase